MMCRKDTHTLFWFPRVSRDQLFVNFDTKSRTVSGAILTILLLNVVAEWAGGCCVSAEIDVLR